MPHLTFSVISQYLFTQTLIKLFAYFPALMKYLTLFIEPKLFARSFNYMKKKKIEIIEHRDKVKELCADLVKETNVFSIKVHKLYPNFIHEDQFMIRLTKFILQIIALFYSAYSF